MSTTREALEAGLAENPDDIAAHAAYADLLTEEGDPRGEYARLQIALEDRDQPADRLRAMEQRAFELRREHEREWLGPLAPHVFPERAARTVNHMVSENVAVTWRRGWVHGIRVGRLTEGVLQAVASAPACRLLAELTIHANGTSVSSRRARVEAIRYVGLRALCESPNARNLRAVELGREDAWHLTAFEGDVAELVKRTPRLEHLRVAADRFTASHVFAARLPHLHTLHVTTNSNRLPIATLGTNPSLRNLTILHLDLVAFVSTEEIEERRDPVYPEELQTLFASAHLVSLKHLALRLPGFGDVGVDELIASGMIARLKGLDLCRCEITDDGGQALANCPAVTNLEYLHLDNNYLSPVGIEALAAVGVQVSDRQLFGPAGESEDDIPF